MCQVEQVDADRAPVSALVSCGARSRIAALDDDAAVEYVPASID
jgi:hypothetical protein